MRSAVILLSAFLILLTGSCQRTNSPREVARGFLNAIEENRYDIAKKYCTPETFKLLEMAESLSKISSAKIEFTGKKYIIISQEYKNDIAIVKFKESDRDEIQTMSLKKNNGQWLVSISKESVMAKQNTNDESTENNVIQNDSLR